MSWLMRTVMGLALAFSASAALAGCPGPCGQGRGGDAGYGGQSAYSGGYSLRTYGDVAQHYGSPSCGRCAAFAHERAYGERYEARYDDRGPPPCRARGCGECRQCGELMLSNGFSYDGGVGPYPEGGYGGGGGYAVGGGFAGAGTGASAGASARAQASASASSSSHVSIHIGGRGGHKSAGGCNTCGGGHKRGYGGHK